MAEQNIENFWNMCEDQLNIIPHYSTMTWVQTDFKLNTKFLTKHP